MVGVKEAGAPPMTTERQEKRPTVVKVCSVCGTFYGKGGVCNKCNQPQQPQREHCVDILAFDVKMEKYVEDFATFSKREKEETVEEIHDILMACSRPHTPAPTLSDEQITILMDLATKKAARTATLATLDDLRKALLKVRVYTDDTFEEGKFLERSDVMKKLQSLRQSTTAEKQESNNSSSKGGMRR
jgi:hypothetical protein